jgi:hypothetical protein
MREVLRFKVRKYVAAAELIRPSTFGFRLRKNQSRLSDKSIFPQRQRPTPRDKVEHIGGAMKRTCCPDRAETNCGNGCSVLLLLLAHGAPSLRA